MPEALFHHQKPKKMKILHTSDWHLGKRLGDMSRLEEQKAVMQEICDVADREEADVVIVAGDLFDTFNPPAEAVDLFYKTLKQLANNGSRPVIAIAGNHDSPDRIEAPDPLARACGIIFSGYPNSEIIPFGLDCGLEVTQSSEGFVELKLPSTEVPLRLLLTPYANEFRMKTCLGSEDSEEELRLLLQERWQNIADSYCDDKGVNLLVAHLFMISKGDELPEEPEDEKPIVHVGGAQVVYTENIPAQIQYTALGHLHRMHSVEAPNGIACYSGSPLSYSFAEANQQKYVVLAEIEPGEKASLKTVELTRGKKLLRKRTQSIDDAVQWLTENPDALVELTLVTDTYLTASDRKILGATHQGIVAVIPEVTNSKVIPGKRKKQIDLSDSMEELFISYFKHEKGQEPNSDLMNLFNELLAEEEQ